MKEITPKQLLEAITSQAFKGVDLSLVLSLKGDELRTFTLEQMERLRAWPQCLGALWLSDQFWTADRILTPRSNNHPLIACEYEMWSREKLSELTDDEYRIAEWIVKLSILSHDLYSHEPFDVEQLGDNLQGRFLQTELYRDSFRYDNKALVDWIRTTPYRHIAAMVCYTMMDQEINWAVENNLAVQDFYANESDRFGISWDKTEDCEAYISKCLSAMQQIVEHYQKGRAAGLNDEEIRVIDMLYGFAPHDFFEEDFPEVREICEAVNKHLPKAPYIKSEQGQQQYRKAVFDELRTIFEKYDTPFDPSDPTDLTLGYMRTWIYDKYYNG